MNANATVDNEQLADTYRAFGCSANALDVSQLFAKYGEAGFLYEDKRRKLTPFFARIEENWDRALACGEQLMWFLTYDSPEGDVWASVGAWRSTLLGWNSQHLVSIGGPTGSRAVMLAAAATRGTERYSCEDQFQQNWFRPSNRFANRVFGSIVPALGEGMAAVRQYMYVAVHLRSMPPEGDADVKAATSEQLDWRQFLIRNRGRVYVMCEELDRSDVELAQLDALYRKVGLRRYRRISVACDHAGQVVGVAIAYRGPLGFNFSFLENRCDVVVDPTLDAGAATGIASDLIRHVATNYSNFEPQFVPVVTDAGLAAQLVSIGATPIREYSQSLWLGTDGYSGWFQHVSSFYDRMTRVERRRGLAATPH